MGTQGCSTLPPPTLPAILGLTTLCGLLRVWGVPVASTALVLGGFQCPARLAPTAHLGPPPSHCAPQGRGVNHPLTPPPPLAPIPPPPASPLGFPHPCAQGHVPPPQGQRVWQGVPLQWVPCAAQGLRVLGSPIPPYLVHPPLLAPPGVWPRCHPHIGPCPHWLVAPPTHLGGSMARVAAQDSITPFRLYMMQALRPFLWRTRGDIK